jgi:Arc/MetJ family transcription regulator
LAVLQAEREALIRLRDEGQIDDEVLRTLQREFDLEESRVHTGSVVAH